MKCEVCGKSEPEVCFASKELAICESCADEAWEAQDDWGGIIPVNGEVSPDECTDYATHPMTVVADEADDAVRFSVDEAQINELEMWRGLRPSFNACARQDAYAAFEAEAGAAEWQPSAATKKLIKELQGGSND